MSCAAQASCASTARLGSTGEHLAQEIWELSLSLEHELYSPLCRAAYAIC